MEKETSRVEAFSDGGFAISLTLLILEIKVPDLSQETTGVEFFHSLAKLWPSYFAFALSVSFLAPFMGLIICISLWVFLSILDYDRRKHKLKQAV